MDTDAGPIFDSLDIDLIIKVLSNTVFSQYQIYYLFSCLIKSDYLVDHFPSVFLCLAPGPFFVFWIPMFYRAQGAQWNSSIIVSSLCYFAALCIFCKFYSTLILLNSYLWTVCRDIQVSLKPLEKRS